MSGQAINQGLNVVILMKSNNEYLVVGIEPENYRIHDMRAKKPIAFKKSDDPNGASMITQEIDEIKFKSKFEGERNVLSYYTPNNVGILLSITHKSINRAKKIFDEYLNPDKFDHRLEKKTPNAR